MGCPPRHKLDFIQSQAALTALSACENYTSQPFANHFPSTAAPLALELLSKMLQFHPDDRITVEEALEHPYMRDFHNQMPEPNCLKLFDFQFEQVMFEL